MDKKYKDLDRSQLQSLVERLAWNHSFGCYTKNGFKEYIWPENAPFVKWILFFDLDHLHELNDKFDSYAPVDKMIKQVLSIVRETDYVAGQLNSGDEFLVCSKESSDPEGLKARLIEELSKLGMSATFSIVPVSSWDLEEAVAPAVAEVKRLKSERGIGR
jgi:GGDEF domain-containing protein